MSKPVVFSFRSGPDLQIALEHVCKEYDLKLSEFLERAVRSKVNECLRDLEGKDEQVPAAG